MAIDSTYDFSKIQIGTYNTGVTELSTGLSSVDRALASGSSEDGDKFNLSNKKFIAGVDIDTAYYGGATALIQVSDYAALSPTEVGGTATFTFGTFPGSGAIGAGGAAIDGTTITLIDDDGTSVVFEIDDATTGNGDGVTGSNIPIINRTLAGADVVGTMGPSNLATSLAYWINQQGTLDIVATNPGAGQVTLTQGSGAGNTTIALSNATNWNAACSVNCPSAFTGGSDGGVHSITVNLLNADGATTTAVTATASATTTTTTDIDNPTFKVEVDNDTTAANLLTCLVANSQVDNRSGIAGGSIVKVSQAVSGSGGNTTSVIVDPETTGLTLVDFGSLTALTGGGIKLELEGSHDDTNWVLIATLDNDIEAWTEGVHRYLVDLTKTYVPYLRLHFNSGAHSVWEDGRLQFFISERTTS